MLSCVVRWCRNHTDHRPNGSGITFHVFPKDPSRKEKWTKAVQLERQENDWIPSKTSKICSIHFKDKDFYLSMKGFTMLSKRAVPVCTMSTAAPAQDAGPSSSTSAQRERGAANAGEGTPLNSDDDVSDDAAQSETGDDLSLYLTFPKKSTESVTASARKNLPEKRSDLRHDGLCNSCGRDIVGYRYTCVQCPDYNLCGACEAKGAHCLHYVLRIPKPAPFAEIQSVLNAIRCQLLYGGGKPPEPKPEPEPQEEPCVETLKLEIKEEQDPLETDDAFQADHNYSEKNTEFSMPVETTQPIQISQPAFDTAMTTEILQGNTLVIIENPVSASSAASHAAAAADGTKRRLAHRSTQPPHLSEKRARLTPQGSANLLIEAPIAGTVPVTTGLQAVTTVPVTTVPQAAGTSETGGREIKEESTFQVFSHSKLESKKRQDKPGQSAGKASTSRSYLTRLI